MPIPSLLELMTVIEEVQSTARALKDKIASINRERSVDSAEKEDLIEALIARNHKIMWLEEKIRSLELELSKFEKPDAP